MDKNVHIINHVGKDTSGINKNHVVFLVDTNALKIQNGTDNSVNANRIIITLTINVPNVKKGLGLMVQDARQFKAKTHNVRE